MPLVLDSLSHKALWSLAREYFSGYSFDTFWSEVGQGLVGLDGEPLFTPTREVASHCLVLLAGIYFLRRYGFTFWEKY